MEAIAAKRRKKRKKRTKGKFIRETGALWWEGNCLLDIGLLT
jgi:hypothetical protein